MKTLCLIVLLSLAISACQPQTITVIVTATPEPSSYPTSPPQPTSRCIDFLEAGRHVGETTCVYGVVYSTYKDPKSGAFFIDFSKSRSTFTSVSFKYTFDAILNRCIEVYGKIQLYRGVPQIVIEQQSQLQYCQSSANPGMNIEDLLKGVVEPEPDKRTPEPYRPGSQLEDEKIK